MQNSGNVLPVHFLKAATLCAAIAVFSPAAAQPGCEDWNSPGFFKVATALDVDRCLAAGADPNPPKEYQQRYALGPLHYAARYGTAEAVAALLDAGADPNPPPSRGRYSYRWNLFDMARANSNIDETELDGLRQRLPQ